MVAVKKDKINGDSLGTGRRKTAIARVRVRAGSGKITVNGLDLAAYFPILAHQAVVLDALEVSAHKEKVDLLIKCHGGGKHGQAGACKMGIARAIIGFDGETFNALRDGGFLTRDSRMKERKKYGQPGARKRFQFSKR